MICKLLTNECFNCSDLENGIFCCLWEKCNTYRTQCPTTNENTNECKCILPSEGPLMSVLQQMCLLHALQNSNNLIVQKMLMQGKFNIHFVNSNIKKSHDFMYLTL